MALYIATLVFVIHCLLPSSTAYSCQQVPGSLVQIDAGGGQVFGVNKDDNIYTLYGSSWTQLPGKLTHVTVGPAGVWGVNRNHNIYKLVGAKWLNVPGLLKQIDAGGNRFVSGVNHIDVIYCLSTHNTVGFIKAGSAANWVKIPGDAGGNRFVSGANHNNGIYCLAKDNTVGYNKAGSAANWVQIRGGLKYYSCGPYSCWGVNKLDHIYMREGINYNGCQGIDPWKRIEGSLSMIEVGGDGSVYGVNSVGEVFRRDSTSAYTPEGNGWTHIPVYSGQVKHVSHDVGHLWLVLKNDNIYDCTI